MPTEAQRWLATLPRDRRGFPRVQAIIEEGRRRGYCICPRARRWLVFPSTESTCNVCGQRETRQSYDFWYAAIR